MDEKFYRWLIPQVGLLIRDPLTRTPLPAEGEQKPWVGPEGRVWRKRVKQGVVTIGQPPETISPPIPEAAFRKSRKKRED